MSESEIIRPRIEIEEAGSISNAIHTILSLKLGQGYLTSYELICLANFEVKLSKLLIIAETREAIRNLKPQL